MLEEITDEMLLCLTRQHSNRTLAAIVALSVLSLANLSALGAELAGTVQGAKQPIAGSTVTLFAAGTDAPRQLAQGRSDEGGAFKLTYADAPAGSILHVVAKGGTPKAGKGASEGLALLSVLGGTPPKSVTINELTTVASAFTCARFIHGESISGKPLGLKIAAGNAPNLVDPVTGGCASRKPGRDFISE